MQDLVVTSISIASMSMSYNLRVMTNNMGAVMNLFMSFLTMSGDDLLALFNVSGVHNLLAELLWDFARILLGNLVALLILLVMASRSRRVSMASRLSSTLVVSSIMTAMVSNNLGVMSYNVRAVMNLLMFLFAVSGDNVFALFNVGYINNNVIFNMTFIMRTLLRDLVALVVLLIMAFRATGVTMTSGLRRGSAKDHGGRKEKY